MSITAQALDTITTQVLLASITAHDKAHATASATAKAHARADMLKELRDPRTGEWIREEASAQVGSKTRIEAAAVGRRASAIRLHDHVVHYQTELDPSRGGMVAHVRPGEVVALGHHYEGGTGYHTEFDSGQWKNVKKRNKKVRYTDYTLRLDDGTEVSQSVKDGSTVSLFLREDVAAAKKLAAGPVVARKPAVKKPPPPAAPEKTIAQQVADAFDEDEAEYNAQQKALRTTPKKPASPPPPVKTISAQAAAPSPSPPALTADKAYQSVKQSRGNLSNAEESALGVYGTTFGYTVVNPYLHHNGQIFDTSKKKYVPATPHEKARAEELIKDIDGAFTKSAPLQQPVTVYRGTGNMNDLFGPVGSLAGKTFTSKAYTSTTTVPQAEGGNGLDYETKPGKLEISVPAGSKVVTGNDFEHEVILPRDARFSVLSDEMDGATRHVKLQYQPGPGDDEKPAVAPPLTISSQAAAPAVPTPAATSTAAADESAAKLVDDMTMIATIGGKSAQKGVLKKNSLADLQAMDAEYTRRGAASGKMTGAHQLVKDEITSRGAAPLPAPSLDELKAAYAATRAKAAAAATAPATEKDLIDAWSHSYRYTGTTEVKDKRTADFATEMRRLLSTNKPPPKMTLGAEDAHKFLAMVDRDAAPQDRELQRGITLSDAAAQRMFQPGKTMDMPVSSWTADPDTAASYAKGEGKAGKTKVILHAAPGAKGLDISALSYWNASVGGGESEVVTGGRYTVNSVTTTGGVMNVYLAQQGFSAH